MIYPNMPEDTIILAILAILSHLFVGWMSPYPHVVMVVKAQYKEMIYF